LQKRRKKIYIKKNGGRCWLQIEKKAHLEKRKWTEKKTDIYVYKENNKVKGFKKTKQMDRTWMTIESSHRG